MTYRIWERKRWREFLAFLKLLRARWPGQKLYLIMDNRQQAIYLGTL